ncbi:MAG: putative iron-regulated protein [Marivirga sp.]|jgi:putative iron-regulated protein
MKTEIYSTLFILGCTLVGCGDKERNQAQDTETVENYAQIVLANYEDTYEGALQMQETIHDFLLSPTASGLAQSKKAWLQARESYGQTEAFRFYGGPIDDENGPEGQINAWPLDEAYIDYVANGGETTNANIINSPISYPEITFELIASLNENGSETNVSSGYHAIEFLLWGQDLTDGPGGGERPFTDFVAGENGTADHQVRRATYLKEVTKLLVSDLGSLVKAWSLDQNNYRKQFIATPEQSLSDIIAGLGKLSKGELAGERIFVAYDLQSKEDEHSCFSDNTHRDIYTNALGIENVFLGNYQRIDGTLIRGRSIYDLLQSENEVLADEIKVLIAESVAACAAIQPPFDQEFNTADGRVRISKAISLLRKQGDKLAEASKVFGFKFNPEDI